MLLAADDNLRRIKDLISALADQVGPLETQSKKARQYLDLREVSILDRTKTPAYEGTLIMARSDDEDLFISEAMVGEVSISEETENVREEEQPEQAEPEANIDYSIYERWIREMKGESA